MNVDVYNRNQVLNMVPDSTKCLISISSPLIESPLLDPDYTTPIPTDGWNDLLQVQFHDIDVEIDIEPGTIHQVFGAQITPFNEQQAHQIIQFIKNNKGKPFIVHCDAGMSRSVAVAVFLEQFFDYKMILHSTDSTKCCNNFVLEKLTEQVLLEGI